MNEILAALDDARHRTAERRESQREADLVKLLKLPEFRRTAGWIIYDVGMLQRLSFAGAIKNGDASAQHTALAEGRRFVASVLHGAIESANPGEADQLLAELNRAIRADRDLIEAEARSAGERQ